MKKYYNSTKYLTKDVKVGQEGLYMKQDLCLGPRLRAVAGYWNTGGKENVANTREHKCKKTKTPI